MTNQTNRAVGVGAAVTGLVAAAAAAVWGPAVGLGLLAGGAWNLASLWCLSRLLQTWIGPPRLAGDQSGKGPAASRRQAVAWLLVKFPLLYGLMFLILRAPNLSLIGFGAGFSLTLLLGLGWLAVHAKPALSRSRG